MTDSSLDSLRALRAQGVINAAEFVTSASHNFNTKVKQLSIDFTKVS